MNPIIVRVTAWPKPQPRPKAYVRGAHASVYDPGTASEFRGRIEVTVTPHRPSEPLSGPLRLDLIIIVPRPKGHFGSGKNADKLKPSSPVYWHLSKGGQHGGDLDNYAKAVADSLTDAAIIADDALIAWGERRKRWAHAGELGGVLIVLQQIADVEPPGRFSELDRRYIARGSTLPAFRPTPPAGDAKPAGNPWRPFTDEFCAAWMQKYMDRYPFGVNTHANIKSAEAIWEAIDGDMDKGRRIVALYLADTEKFVVDSGHALAVLASRLPRYMGQLAPKQAKRTRGELGKAIDNLLRGQRGSARC